MQEALSTTIANSAYSDSCATKQTVYLCLIDRPKLAPKGATHMADGQYYKLSSNRVFIWRDGWVNKRVRCQFSRAKGRNDRASNARWTSLEYELAKQSMLKNAKNYTLVEAIRLGKQLGREPRTVLRKIRKAASELNVAVNFETGIVNQTNLMRSING